MLVEDTTGHPQCTQVLTSQRSELILQHKGSLHRQRQMGLIFELNMNILFVIILLNVFFFPQACFGEMS